MVVFMFFLWVFYRKKGVGGEVVMVLLFLGYLFFRGLLFFLFFRSSVSMGSIRWGYKMVLFLECFFFFFLGCYIR